MSLRIASVRTVDDRGGSIQLAVSAARTALEAAGVEARAVKLLINAGVYRDENICEPAMAPFVQRELGIDATCIDGGGAGPFSFDINDSACGVLTACEIAEQLVTEPDASVLVVTSDVDPNEPGGPPLGFRSAGAALVLQHCRDGMGFRAFYSQTHGEHRDRYLGSLDWTPQAEDGGGEHRVTIAQSADFSRACGECGARAVETLLDHEGLRLRDIDLIVPAEWPRGFADALREALKCDEAMWLLPERTHPPRHTAATARCMERALEMNHKEKRKRRVLFVAAGAGIKISLALYDAI